MNDTFFPNTQHSVHWPCTGSKQQHVGCEAGALNLATWNPFRHCITFLSTLNEKLLP